MSTQGDEIIVSRVLLKDLHDRLKKEVTRTTKRTSQETLEVAKLLENTDFVIRKGVKSRRLH